MKLFVGNVKLLVSPLSKETTEMDMYKPSYWEDILKWKFNVEKYEELNIGSKNIKVEYW